MNKEDTQKNFNEISPKNGDKQLVCVKTSQINRCNGTISDITIRQPQTVTFGNYSCTAVQEDMLSDIAAQLQENLFYNIEEGKIVNGNDALFVKLERNNYPCFGRHTNDFKDAVMALTKWEFEFTWSGQLAKSTEAKSLMADSENDECTMTDEQIVFTGPIFITRAKINTDPKTVYLEVHHLAVPFLLYSGKGAGYTEYIKSESDNLESKYSKRLYKMFKTWETLDRDAVDVSIEDFRAQFKLSEKYDNKSIRVYVLDVAKRELLTKNINFEYEFICKSPVSGVKKQKADTIRFKLLSKKPKLMIDKESAASRREQTLQMYLADIADKEKRDSCRLYAQDIIERGGFTNLNNKFRYYRKRLQDGFMTEEKYKNTMLKVVRETYNIELRNPDHVRRATIITRKIKNSNH